MRYMLNDTPTPHSPLYHKCNAQLHKLYCRHLRNRTPPPTQAFNPGCNNNGLCMGYHMYVCRLCPPQLHVPWSTCFYIRPPSPRTYTAAFTLTLIRLE